MIRSAIILLMRIQAIMLSLCPVAVSDEIVKEINCGGFTAVIAYDTDEFYKGTITVKDKGDSLIFKEEAFYSHCYFDTLTDVDGNGVKELIAGLSTGSSPYLWSMLVIFDFSGDSLKMFSVLNSELKFTGDGNAYFTSTVRLSPAYLGALYEYPVISKDGRMYVPFDDDLVKFSKDIKFDESYYQEAIHNFENEIDECTNRQDYLSLFEVYMITSAFSGRRGFAEEYMRKTYKCKDTGEALEEAREYADSILDAMRKEDFVYRKD